MHVNMTVDYVRKQHSRWLKYVQQRWSQEQTWPDLASSRSYQSALCLTPCPLP